MTPDPDGSKSRTLRVISGFRMHLLAFGINHHTAPVDIREKAAFASDKLIGALHEVTAGVNA